MMEFNNVMKLYAEGKVELLIFDTEASPNELKQRFEKWGFKTNL